MSAFFFQSLIKKFQELLLNFFDEIHHHTIVAVLRNSGWLLLERVFRLALSLVVGVLVARYLGPSEYGHLAFAVAFVAIFQALSNLGMDGIVVREIAKAPNFAPIILGSAVALRIISGILFWVLSSCIQLLAYGYNSQSFLLTLIIGLSMVFQASDCIDYWFQSQSQSNRVVLVKIATTLFSNGIKIALVVYSAPLEAFAALISFEYALCALGLFFSYRFHSAKSHLKFNYVWCRLLFLEGWPFMAASFINIMQARVEFLIIEKMLGANLLGQYAAALGLIEMFDVFGVIFTISVFPKLIDISKVDFNRLMSKLYLSAIIIFCLMLPFIFLLWASIDHIYGVKYMGVKEIFLLMSVRPLLAIIGMVRSMALKLEGRNLYALVCSVAGIFVALTLSLLLIPFFGIIGAIISSVLSYFVSNFALDYFLYKRNFFNILQLH